MVRSDWPEAAGAAAAERDVVGCALQSPLVLCRFATRMVTRATAPGSDRIQTIAFKKRRREPVGLPPPPARAVGRSEEQTSARQSRGLGAYPGWGMC